MNNDFFGTMFNYIGRKLKVIAKVILVVGILISVILAILMFVNASENYSRYYWSDNSLFWVYLLSGFILLIVGSISTVAASFLIYAFGAIAEKYLEDKNQVSYTVNSGYNTNRPTSTNPPSTSDNWTCPKCGKKNKNYVVICSCGQPKQRK